MGWASGSGILCEVWEVVREFVPEEDRVDVAAELMLVFQGHDCDTLAECERKDWPEMAEAYDLLYPEPEAS